MSTICNYHLRNGEVYIRYNDVIDCLKDDLLAILSNPDDDLFTSDYLKLVIASREKSEKEVRKELESR